MLFSHNPAVRSASHVTPLPCCHANDTHSQPLFLEIRILSEWRAYRDGHANAKSSHPNWFFTWTQLLNNAQRERVTSARVLVNEVEPNERKTESTSKKAIKFNYFSHKFRFRKYSSVWGRMSGEEEKCKQRIINIVIDICDRNSLMNFIRQPNRSAKCHFRQSARLHSTEERQSYLGERITFRGSPLSLVGLERFCAPEKAQ